MMNMRQNMVNGLLAVAGQDDVGTLVPLEYIESTGEQWIDPNILVSGNLDIEASIQFTQLTPQEINGGFFISSGVTYGADYAGALGGSSNRFWLRCHGGEAFNTGVPFDTDRHTFHINTATGEWSIDSVTGSVTVRPFPETNAHVLVFGRGLIDGVHQDLCHERLDWLKIKAGGIFVRDLVPMKRVEDNKPGLYDLVTGKFHVNQGTGADFLMGPMMTARSYVQDGLVGLWDGIENSAYDVHDGSIQSWTDLAGGIGDAEFLAGSVKWKDNGLSIKAGTDRWAIPIGTYFSGKNTCTLEAVIATTGWYSTTKANRIISNSESGGIIMYGNSSYYGVQRYSSSNRTYNGASHSMDTIGARTCVSLMTTGSDISIAVGGKIKATNATAGNIGQGAPKLALSYEPNGLGNPGHYSDYGAMSGTYHGIRLYSKALSAEELAHNYDIDRRRFLLPST